MKPLPQDLKEKIEQVGKASMIDRYADGAKNFEWVEYQDGFNDGAEALYNLMGEGGRWVPLGERLPDKGINENYRVRHNDGSESKEYWNGTGFVNFQTSTWNYFTDISEWLDESPIASDRDLVEALKKIDAKINTLIQEDPKGRAIEVAIIMANTLKEISGICTTALKTVLIRFTMLLYC